MCLLLCYALLLSNLIFMTTNMEILVKIFLKISDLAKVICNICFKGFKLSSPTLELMLLTAIIVLPLFTLGSVSYLLHY